MKIEINSVENCLLVIYCEKQENSREVKVNKLIMEKGEQTTHIFWASEDQKHDGNGLISREEFANTSSNSKLISW